MAFVLKLKHWQIFLFLMVISFTSNFTWVGEPGQTAIINWVGIGLYFMWYLALGYELHTCLPAKIEISNTMFLINVVVLIGVTAVVTIIYNGAYSGNGLFPFLFALYVFYAMAQFFLFPAKILKSIEKGEEARFSDYIGTFFLIILWPIGIWMIQPRVNRIANETIE